MKTVSDLGPTPPQFNDRAANSSGDRRFAVETRSGTFRHFTWLARDIVYIYSLDAHVDGDAGILLPLPAVATTSSLLGSHRR
jgi:hypothetical protein